MMRVFKLIGLGLSAYLAYVLFSYLYYEVFVYREALKNRSFLLSMLTSTFVFALFYSILTGIIGYIFRPRFKGDMT